MTTNNLIDLVDASYSDLERAGLPASFIEDYQSFKRNVKPQSGTDVDPNGIYRANLTCLYVDTVTPSTWFNPALGADTGWIQIA
jgi:hypothetical protein